MNGAVVYFSRTGNTRRLAEAIANTLRIPLIDLASTLPSTIEKYDLLVLGTPVEGASPAKETLAFAQGMNRRSDAKAVLFTTYKIFGNMRTMKAIDKILSAKGYTTILMVSKKGMQPEKEADFSEVIQQVKNAVEKV